MKTFSPEYVLARFIDDPLRQEARNIGVIVWAHGAVSYRFTDPTESGIVVDENIFSRWVNLWAAKLQGDSIEDLKGKSCSRRTPKFLDAICSYSDDRFALERGGVFFDDVAKKDVAIAADQLFRDLVLPKSPNILTDDKNPSFVKVCEELLADAGYLDREDYRINFPLTLSVAGCEQHWKYDYALADDGLPDVLILRVSNTEKAINAYVKFQEAIKADKIDQRKCAALIQDDASTSNPESHDLLQRVSIPIHTANPEKAVPLLEKLRKSA